MPYSAEDVLQAARQRPHVGGHREAQPDRVPRCRIRILSDDQHPHLIERKRERPQHILPGGQVSVARRDLGPQELPHLRDLTADGFAAPAPSPLRPVHSRGVPSREVNLAARLTETTASPDFRATPRRRPAPAADRRSPCRWRATPPAVRRGTSRRTHGPRRRRAPTPTDRRPTAAATADSASRSAVSAAVDTLMPTPDASAMWPRSATSPSETSVIAVAPPSAATRP